MSVPDCTGSQIGTDLEGACDAASTAPGATILNSKKQMAQVLDTIYQGLMGNRDKFLQMRVPGDEMRSIKALYIPIV